MRYSYLPTTAIVFMPLFMFAQNTVGLIEYDPNQAQDGYTLLYPAQQKNVYLLDNCGRIVHQWSDTIYGPGNSAYLMDNGDILRCGKSSGIVNPIIERGGSGEVVEKRDWAGQLLWRYKYNSPTFRMHHDIAPLPNGNVLIVAWELKTLAEAVAVGKDTTGFGGTSVWPDHIIEVQQTAIDTGDIVWEWHAWDHLVQDVDSTLPNFGVVADHPERININFGATQASDWMHVNSISYNADLDQILISVPNFDEIWIIDHSTTTAEAASSGGGNSGMGGDLLYRWGNPLAYGRGSMTDQRSFFQHDARWVGPTLAPNDPDSGRIMFFNNRFGGDFSTVDMIDPPIDAQSNYTLQPAAAYGPDTVTWRYTAPVPTSLFSSGLSGGHKLPNGNFFITSGTQGHLFEVNAAQDIVWEYEIPLAQGTPISQGTTTNVNSIFRATKYPASHPFLSTQALPPIGYLELQPDSNFCGQLVTAMQPLVHNASKAPYPNPTTGRLWMGTEPGETVQVMDAMGRIIQEQRTTRELVEFDLGALSNGIYLLRSTSSGRTYRVVKD